jgi:hypothetical protein
MKTKTTIKCTCCGECCKTVPCIFAQMRFGIDEWNVKPCPEFKEENGVATCSWIERDPWMQHNFLGTGCEKPVYAKKPEGTMSLLDVVKECASHKDFVEGFNRLTNCHFLEDSRSPIVRMVDEATGYETRLIDEQVYYMQIFILFVYETVWTRLPEEAFTH